MSSPKSKQLTGMRAAGLAATSLMAGGGIPALIVGGGAMSLKAFEDQDDEKYERDSSHRKRLEKIAEKEERTMIAETHVTSDGLKNGACNFINNPTNIHPTIAAVIEDETGVPCSNRHLFDELDKIRFELEDAMKKNNTKLALRLANRLTFAQATLTEKLIELSEQQDKNPAIFIACQAAAAHPDDADKQAGWIAEKIFTDPTIASSSDPKIMKEYSTLRKLFTFNGILNISWAIGHVSINRLLIPAIKIILKLSKILFVDVIANAVQTLVGKNLLAGVAATMVTDPMTGGAVSVGFYCLSERAWGITSVGHVLSSVGCVFLFLGGLVSVFGPGSNVGSWLYDLTSRIGMGGEKTPPLTTMLTVLNQTLSGAEAFGKDIYNIFPNFDDMFMVKLYNNTNSIGLRFITKFRIFMEICQDIQKGTPVNKVQIINYVWKNGIRAYNYTKALESDVGFGLSPNNTTIEVATQLTAVAFYNTAEAIASNPYIKGKMEEKFTELVTSENSTLKNAAISLIQSAAPEMIEAISKKLPGIVVNTAREVVNSPEFKELANESNVSELANSVTLAVTDQIVSNVHRVMVSDQKQAMIAGGNTRKTQQQWTEIVNNAASRVLEYAISNPDKIAETATNVVSVAAPIVEHAARSAISSAFGNAKAEGMLNTMMLGAIKGAISTGYHTTQGLETVSYVAGSAARDTAKAAINLPGNVYEGVSRIVGSGANLASNIATQTVDAGIRTAGQAATLFSFRSKRSVKKTKKSVKKSRKRSVKKSRKRSVKKTKRSVKKSRKR